MLDNIKDSLSQLKGQIQESPVYNSIRERFIQLPAKAQKAIFIGSAILITLLLFSLPYSTYRSSLKYDAEYAEKRQIVKKLLAISALPTTSSLSSFNTADRLKSSATQKLIGLRLGEDTPSFSVTVAPKGSYAKKPIQETALEVELKNLNLKQAIAAGHSIQNIMPLGKLTAMNIYQSLDQPNYLNARYTLSYFQAPKPNTPKAEEPKKRRGR